MSDLKTTRELVLDILLAKQAEAKAYIESRSYGEWSCGQQDADCEADEHFDKMISDAICIYDNNNVHFVLSERRRQDIYEFVNEIIDDFRYETRTCLNNY